MCFHWKKTTMSLGKKVGETKLVALLSNEQWGKEAKK